MPGLNGLPNDPLGTDNLSTADNTFRSILASLRSYAVKVLSGNLGDRPAASAGSLGALYVATDQNPRTASIDAGNAQIEIPARPAGGAERLRIIRGRLAADGTTIRGGGFTSSRSTTGLYVISFTTAFADPPSIEATPEGAAAFVQIAGAPGGSASSAAIAFLDSAGNGVDTRFTFTITGAVA